MRGGNLDLSYVDGGLEVMQWQRVLVLCVAFGAALQPAVYPKECLAGAVEGDGAKSDGVGGGEAERHAAVVRRVDQLLAARWSQAGVSPAALSSDSEFLRRASLDLTGVIPAVADVRRFLDDPRSDKRDRLLDQLLASPRHAWHLATSWRRIILPNEIEPGQQQSVVGVQNWLFRQFLANQRFDNLVGDLLVATDGGGRGPALYYTSVGLEPEKLATSTARTFLGLQLGCAQCHDHPFDRWSQEDFWGFAAFFARLKQAEGQPGMMPARLVDAADGEVTLPDTDIVVPPKFPGSQWSIDPAGTRRTQLAIWIVSRDNPYLARATVNWAWAHLFGRGLVEPVDDLGDHNPPSHPQLLDALTEYFIESGFDIRQLFHTLTRTEAYQLSSQATGDGEVPAELFARMAVKVLTPDQLYDSISRASLRRPARGPEMPRLASPLLDAERREFTIRMASIGRSMTEYRSGLPQALLLMGGPLIGTASDAGRSGLLQALQAPIFDEAESVEVMFLATLGRRPSDEERVRFVEYVRGGGATGDGKQARADVLWALLNTAEFGLNH